MPEAPGTFHVTLSVPVEIGVVSDDGAFLALAGELETVAALAGPS